MADKKDNSLIRINKYLSECGLGSRRACEKLILESRVQVNDKTITELSTHIDIAKDVVVVDGELAKMPQKVYYMMNKPSGYLTTLSDPENRPTIKELLPENIPRIFPVGRLDLLTRGLLLLTNDGDIANRLSHPRYGIERLYEVVIVGRLDIRHQKQLEKGIRLSEGMTNPTRIKIQSIKQDHTRLELVITQGWNRQIRRMFEYFNYRVKDINRVEFGPVKLGRLSSGTVRKLNSSEINSLLSLLFKGQRR